MENAASTRPSKRPVHALASLTTSPRARQLSGAAPPLRQIRARVGAGQTPIALFQPASSALRVIEGRDLGLVGMA